MIARQAFHYIFINANSLTELALRSVPDNLESLLDDLDPIEDSELSELEISLEDLDFAAMEGLDFYDPDIYNSESELPTLSSDERELKDLPIESTSSDSEFDIEVYLANVYAHEEQLTERINVAYSKLDHNRVEQLISLLPPELPAIDSKMNGASMTSWLTLYANDVQSVKDLLIAIRQLDFT